MKKYKIIFINIICIFTIIALTGCAKENDSINDRQAEAAASDETTYAEGQPASSGTVQAEELPASNENMWAEGQQGSAEDLPEKEPSSNAEATSGGAQKDRPEPVTIETDWSDYFAGINGTAVIYDPVENRYIIYNEERALTRRSPCSTFKIISSLTALENGLLIPEHSTRTWSGEIFWNEEWNKDIDFSDAFHSSCVWYFREVVDEIGKEMMQDELSRLKYGNCDISDWQGSLNTNNSNPKLTGFWIESSLLISPKEQTEVMERIFGDHSCYTEEPLEQLKQVMLLQDQSETDISIYGKTGTGMDNGAVVDAWFTGFADVADKRIYFCIYMGETADKNVSSAKAKEAAVKIISDYIDQH